MTSLDQSQLLNGNYIECARELEKVQRERDALVEQASVLSAKVAELEWAIEVWKREELLWLAQSKEPTDDPTQ